MNRANAQDSRHRRGGLRGLHLATRLLAAGAEVIGLDSLDPYYDPALKKARLAKLQALPGFRCEIMDLAEHERVLALVDALRPTEIVHLAAQAGVPLLAREPASLHVG